ncbi:hypothetical protein M405DRAFT_478871 [Rhizopogon salebrosus TDB-379]|nr:hypothetical protein M405DRAFT_478871 [Rhizopogon salebrosus TDB-379]
MSSPSLLRRLLKRLCQVLAALTTSSAHRLRFLLSCLRRFLAEICGHSRHTGIVSRSSAPGSDTTLASASGARFPQVTLPLPLHNGQITSATAASSTQGVVSSSTPSYTSSISEQVIPFRTSSQAEVNNTIILSTAIFTPIGANNGNDIRYENRHPVTMKFQHSRGTFPTDHVPG